MLQCFHLHNIYKLESIYFVLLSMPEFTLMLANGCKSYGKKETITIKIYYLELSIKYISNILPTEKHK